MFVWRKFSDQPDTSSPRSMISARVMLTSSEFGFAYGQVVKVWDFHTQGKVWEAKKKVKKKTKKRFTQKQKKEEKKKERKKKKGRGKTNPQSQNLPHRLFQCAQPPFSDLRRLVQHRSYAQRQLAAVSGLVIKGNEAVHDCKHSSTDVLVVGINKQNRQHTYPQVQSDLKVCVCVWVCVC